VRWSRRFIVVVVIVIAVVVVIAVGILVALANDRVGEDRTTLEIDGRQFACVCHIRLEAGIHDGTRIPVQSGLHFVEANDIL
jgi:signal transduction histidine kinase